MKRRTVLLTATCGLASTGVGCLSNDEPESGCPDTWIVEEEFEAELSYDEYDLERFHDSLHGIFLVTESDESDLFERGFWDEELLTNEDREWIEETDFTENVILAIQVFSSSDSSDLKIYGVARTGINDETFHAYSCISRPGRTDDLEPYARLLRVPHGGNPPDSVALTHVEGENSVYRS